MSVLAPPYADAEFAAIVDELTRRGFLAGGLGSAGLLGLAACSSADQSSPSAGSTATTRTVTGAKGPVVIPANPRRIVCVDPYSPFDLLGVGVTPAGAPAYSGAIAANQRQAFAAITKVDTAGGGTDLEKVAALHPDLIFGLDYQDGYRELSAIAPTVFLHFTTSADWPAIAAQCAAALGRGAQETSLVNRYTSRARAIRQADADLLASLRVDMVADAGGGNYAVYYPDSGNGHVLSEAGFRFASASAGQTGALSQVSYEELDRLADADVLLYVASTAKPLLAQPAWARLPAVKAGRAYPIANAFPNNYAVALALLDELAGILSRAGTGTPR